MTAIANMTQWWKCHPTDLFNIKKKFIFCSLGMMILFLIKTPPLFFHIFFFVLLLLSLMMDEFGRRCVNLDAIFGRPVCWYYGREKTLYSYLIPSLVFIFPSQGQVGEHAQDRPLRNYQHDAQRHHRRLRSEVCKNKKQINSRRVVL